MCNNAGSFRKPWYFQDVPQSCLLYTAYTDILQLIIADENYQCYVSDVKHIDYIFSGLSLNHKERLFLNQNCVRILK